MFYHSNATNQHYHPAQNKLFLVQINVCLCYSNNAIKCNRSKRRDWTGFRFEVLEHVTFYETG